MFSTKHRRTPLARNRTAYSLHLSQMCSRRYRPPRFSSHIAPPFGTTITAVANGNDDDTVDKQAEALVRVAQVLIRDTGGTLEPHILENLRRAMHDAVIAASVEYSVASLRIATADATPQSPRGHFQAVFAACALAQTLNSRGNPARFPIATAVGTIEYVRGCALTFATSIAHVSSDGCPAATNRFIAALDELHRSNAEDLPRPIMQNLLQCLVQFEEREDQQVGDSTLEPARPRRLRGCRVVVALGTAVLLVALLGFAAGWVSAPGESHVEDRLPPWDTAKPPTFNSRVLSNADLHLYAYPVGRAPSDSAMARPQNPPNGYLTVEVGEWFEVQISIKSRGLSPNGEHYYLGFWPTGSMSVRHGTSTVRRGNGALKQVPDLTATPVSVDDPDPNGAAIVYTVQVAATALLAADDPSNGQPSGQGYMCGFNAQAVHVILSSSEDPRSVLTTLPVYVLRKCS